MKNSKLYTSDSSYKHTPAEQRYLFMFILNGQRDGLLSIANAKRVCCLTDSVMVTFDVFISPEPVSVRKNKFNVFALNRATGQISVMGRELSKNHCLCIARGQHFKDG